MVLNVSCVNIRTVYHIRLPKPLHNICTDCKLRRKTLVILLLIDTVSMEDFVSFSVDHLQIMRALGKSSTFDNVCKGSTNGNQRKSKWF